MKTNAITMICVTLAVATQASAGELILNGRGLRTRWPLGTLYELSLYVPEDLSGAGSREILEADRPMELVLVIQSSLISRARFQQATAEGFARAARAGYDSPQIPAFLEPFNAREFRKGDIVRMRYHAGGLTTFHRRGSEEKPLGEIPGLEFKKALFAIWLGPDPVQESLRDDLVGAR